MRTRSLWARYADPAVKGQRTSLRADGGVHLLVSSPLVEGIGREVFAEGAMGAFCGLTGSRWPLRCSRLSVVSG